MNNSYGIARLACAIVAGAIVISGCVASGSNTSNPDPTATALVPTPRNPAVNEQVSFQVSCGGSGVTYAWAFGDGATSSSATPTHAYAAAGTYAVQVQCTDAQSKTAVASTALVVANVVGIDSRFSVSPSNSVAPNDIVTFTPTGSGLTYSWDFGDGSAVDTSASPNHAYAAAGTYQARLSVSDGSGQTADSSQTISVSAVNPSVQLAPINIVSRNNKSIAFAATASDPANNPLTYNWDFGDGTVVSGGGANQAHTYAANGSYPVKSPWITAPAVPPWRPERR